MSFLRAMRVVALVILVAAFSLGTIVSAHAAAPQAKTTPPGFYRVMLGDFEVTALLDGTVELPVDKILSIKPDQVQKTLARSYLKAPLETSVNAYLINTGAKLVMVDAGAAGLFGPTLGKLPANLKAAGYSPEQVDEIYITHLHPDHVGGITVDGKAIFPNATIRADKHDADFWLSEENMKKAPKDFQDFFLGAQGALKPYIAAGKFKTFEGNTDLVPGVKAQITHGHTPGHTFYVAESKGQKMVFWGDLMHVAAVQFENPGVTIQFDTDSKAAAAQRRRAYGEAAKQGYLVGIAHVSFPGIGRLRAAGSGYTWVPVNYSVVK